VRVERVHRRLLEVVDRRVVEDVPVEVAADDLDQLVLEVAALGVQLLELELLADRLERLRELGREQLVERLLVRRARAADRLRHLQHVLRGLVDPHEERDLDVGADVVLADQAVLAAAVDVDRLDRDVHHLGAVDDRQDHAAGEHHHGPAFLLTINALPWSTCR
jgi:hypothetical protein